MKFKNIQAARAVAANGVLLSHLLVVEAKYGHGFEVLPGGVAWGACGVDLFFVVSGFIMAIIAAREDLRTFVVSRLTRIYPPYWFYSILVFIVSLLAPGMVNSSVAQAPVLWKSFFLIPDSTLPLLAVGWTLTHEIYFYGVFALLLWFGGVRPLFLIAWALLCVVVHELFSPRTPLLMLMAHPLTLEFILGAGVGLAIRAGKNRFSSAAILAGVTALFITFSCLKAASVLDESGSWERVIALGLPFTFIVYGITATQSLSDSWWKSTLVVLGDASYSTYLSHVLVLSALGRIFSLIPSHNLFMEVLFVILSIAAANIWGILSFRFIEGPSLRLFRRIALSEN